MVNINNLPNDKDLALKVIEDYAAQERQKREQGILGRIWGGASSVPNNIAALAIILLILTGIGYTIFVSDRPPHETRLSVKDFWKIITPLIAIAFGGLFRHKAKKAR